MAYRPPVVYQQGPYPYPQQQQQGPYPQQQQQPGWGGPYPQQPPSGQPYPSQPPYGQQQQQPYPSQQPPYGHQQPPYGHQQPAHAPYMPPTTYNPAPPPASGRKKALLVGCCYPGTSAALNGCINDVQVGAVQAAPRVFGVCACWV